MSAPVLHPLSVALPPQFETALGLQSPARWLALYWEPQLGQVCYTDGETVGLGNAQAWQIFCRHPEIKPLLSSYQLGDGGNSAQHYLLLDRVNQQLYAGEVSVVSDCLRHPDTLEMLAQLHQPHHQPDWQWLTQLRAFMHQKWLLILAGIISLSLGLGLLYTVGEVVVDVVEEVLDD